SRPVISPFSTATSWGIDGVRSRLLGLPRDNGGETDRPSSSSSFFNGTDWQSGVGRLEPTVDSVDALVLRCLREFPFPLGVLLVTVSPSAISLIWSTRHSFPSEQAQSPILWAWVPVHLFELLPTSVNPSLRS